MKRFKKGCAILLAMSLMLGTVSGYKTTAEAKANVKTAQTEATRETHTERTVTKKKNATIYNLGNGKKKAEFYAGDVRFTDENGELQDYDTSLVRADDATGDYMYETAQSDKKSYFPEKISEETPVLTEYDRYAVSIRSDEEAKKTRKSKKAETQTEQVTDLYAKKEEKETSIEYEGIWENASLEYESTNDGLKESIILDDKAAPSRYSFIMTMKNCCVVTQEQLMKDRVEAKKKIETDEGEALYLYDVAEEKLVGSLPAGYMMDSAGEYSEGCTYVVKLKREENTGAEISYTYEMCLEADEDYLEAPERKYPVTIDPSITWSSTAAQTSSAYVCRTSPGSTYTDENTNILCVGKRDTSTSVCRSYIRFEGINGALADMYVDKATLTLNTTQATTGMSIYVRNVCSSWNASTITYNTQPKKTDGVWGSFKTSKAAEKVEVSLDANMLYNWTRNEETSYGIELTDSKTDSNSTSTKTAWIYNALSMNSAKIPKLVVEYYEVDRTATPQLKYKVYRKNAGWSTWEEDGETAGDLTETRKLRAFKMDFESNGFNVGTVKYRAYFEDSGWTDWMPEGEMAGDTNADESMKAVEMKVYNANNLYESSYYNIYYRTYVKGRGWLGWAKSGATAGDYTSGACIEGIEAVVVPILNNRQWYVDEDGEEDYNTFLDYVFSSSVAEKSATYGIGVKFFDSVMASRYGMTINAYTRSGVVDTKETEAEFTFCGGTVTDPLIGYNMEFTDKSLAAKYDVEHVTSVNDANVEVETWKKNLEVSGTASSGVPLGMVSYRIVPKNYQGGEKACYSNSYVFSEDGYSFGNGNISFGYPKPYYIPKEKWIAMLGKTEGETKYAIYKDEEWGGNCFGMCLSSLLFFRDFWDYSIYKSGIDRNAQSTYNLCFQKTKRTRELSELIGNCQLSWHLGNYGKTHSETYMNFPAIIKILQETGQKQHHILVVSRIAESYEENPGEWVAHAVIPTAIRENGTGNYEIDLYDVNYPGKLKTATISNTSFKYERYTYVRLLDVDELIEGRENVYEEIQQLSRGEISALSSTEEESQTIAVANCSSYSIVDENGQDITKSDEVEVIPSYDGSDAVFYKMPRGDYKIYVDETEEQARVIVYNKQASTTYEFEGEAVIEASFEKENMLESEVHVLDKEKKVQIYAFDTKGHEKKWIKKNTKIGVLYKNNKLIMNEK